MNQLQQVEEFLEDKINKGSNPLILQLISQLDKAVVYSNGGNVSTNKKLWNNYSNEWKVESSWVQKMANNVGMKDDLKVLGDEWASREDTTYIIENYIYPFIHQSFKIAEIGVGGGRIASEVFFKVHSMYCYDISEEMLQRASRTISNKHSSLISQSEKSETRKNTVNVMFKLIGEDMSLPIDKDQEAESFDFIYAFDVFPHVDLHVLYSYLKKIASWLKPGARAFLSTADITSVDGWDRFEAQKSATVGGFCFTSPDVVLLMVERAGLILVKRGSASDQPRNVYLRRDLLIVVQKPGTASNKNVNKENI